MERVDVGETGESIEDGLNLLGKRFTGELDLAHVESCEVLSAPVLVVPFFISASFSFAPVVLRRSCVVARSSQANSSSFERQEKVPTSNSRNLETCSDLSRQSSLSSAQDNVQELLRRRHRGDILPRRLHFGGIWGLLIFVARTDRIPAPLLRKKFVASRLSFILPERRSADTLARPQTPTSEVQCQARPSLEARCGSISMFDLTSCFFSPTTFRPLFSFSSRVTQVLCVFFSPGSGVSAISSRRSFNICARPPTPQRPCICQIEIAPPASGLVHFFLCLV